MRARVITTMVTTLAIGVLCATAAENPDAASYQTVYDAVQQWVTQLDGGVYKATIRARDGVSPLPSREINARLVAFTEGDVYMAVGFSEAPKREASVRELQATLEFVALDRIPVPGVNATAWETRFMTPRSSFKEGVTFESWKDGVLRLRVQTTFFAASACRTDLVFPMDSPLPAGTCFRITAPIKADLIIEGRVLKPEKDHAEGL